MYRTGVHPPSSRDSDEWHRERQSVHIYNIPTKARAVGRLSNILKSSFWDNNFEDSIADWETDILKHDRETQSSFPDDVKIAHIMNDTKRTHQEHLRLNTLSLKNIRA